MKKLTIWMIISNWILYVFVPIIFLFIYGRYPENMQSMGYVPQGYMTKAAVLITVVFFVSSFVVYLIPEKTKPVLETVVASKSYFYVAILLYVFLLYIAGGLDFHLVLSGGINGALISYYSLFFFPGVLLVIYMYCVKNRGSLLVLLGAYLGITLLTKSRSGALHIVVYLIGYLLLIDRAYLKKLSIDIKALAKKHKRQIYRIVALLFVLGPILFVISTNARGSISSNSSHSSIETIAARCSCLDEAGLALYTSERNNSNMRIFREKYGVFHQIGCIIDSSLPGDFFSGDVDSNQYFRAMVGYMSAKDVLNSYSSTNMMLPTYLVLKYGYFWGSFISIVLIVGTYILITRLRNPVFKITMITIVFSEILVYFDWIMVWRSFLRVFLTVMTFQIITKCFKVTILGICVRKKKLYLPKLKSKSFRI